MSTQRISTGDKIVMLGSFGAVLSIVGALYVFFAVFIGLAGEGTLTLGLAFLGIALANVAVIKAAQIRYGGGDVA